MDLNSTQKLPVPETKHIIAVLVYVILEKATLKMTIMEYSDVIEIECIAEPLTRFVLFNY